MEKLFKIYTDEQSRMNLLLNNFLDTKKEPIDYFSKISNEREINTLVNTIAGKIREMSIKIHGTNYSVSYDSIDFEVRNTNCRNFGCQIYLRNTRESIKCIEYSKIIPSSEYMTNRTLIFKYCYLLPFLKFIEYYYENGFGKIEKIKDIQIVKLYTFEEAFTKENEGEIFQVGMFMYKYENDKLMSSFMKSDTWEEETSMDIIHQLLRNKLIWIQPKEEK